MKGLQASLTKAAAGIQNSLPTAIPTKLFAIDVAYVPVTGRNFTNLAAVASLGLTAKNGTRTAVVQKGAVPALDDGQFHIVRGFPTLPVSAESGVFTHRLKKLSARSRLTLLLYA